MKDGRLLAQLGFGVAGRPNGSKGKPKEADEEEADGAAPVGGGAAQTD